MKTEKNTGTIAFRFRQVLLYFPSRREYWPLWAELRNTEWLRALRHTHGRSYPVRRIPSHSTTVKVKVKVIPQQAKVAQGVPGRSRSWIFFAYGTTRVVGRQPYAPAAFTPGEIPGTHFQRLSRPQGTWVCWREPRKKSPVTPPGIDPRNVRLVAQCLDHYATPGPTFNYC